MSKLLLTAMAGLLLSVVTASAGPFEDGDAAYRRGDYATALQIFQTLAVQGDARAQLLLGTMA
jgi:TPR repeat protein